MLPHLADLCKAGGGAGAVTNGAAVVARRRTSPAHSQTTFLRGPDDGRIADGAVEATLDPWSPVVLAVA